MATKPIGYGGPNPGRSGSDPRGRLQNQSGYQQQRYENQQGPFAAELARQMGRANETQFADYGDIMKRYGEIASGGGGQNRGKVSYDDPFESYGGFREFSQTGGYSPLDIANMRARGVSPIRASYAAAQRGIGQQRALQGGYSPNAVAARVKMAREQGQGMADAVQNVEAGLAEARNKGRLAGLSGMSDIEKQRLAAQIDVGKFNALGDQESEANKLRALQGMSSLYGTTPGMSQLFASQLNSSIGQGGQFGVNLMGQDIASQNLPGQYETWRNRIGDAANMAYPWLDYFDKQPQQQGGGQPDFSGYDQIYSGGVQQPQPPTIWQGPQQSYPAGPLEARQTQPYSTQPRLQARQTVPFASQMNNPRMARR